MITARLLSLFLQLVLVTSMKAVAEELFYRAAVQVSITNRTLEPEDGKHGLRQ